MNKYKLEWHKLLCSRERDEHTDRPNKKLNDYRTPFKKDIDRITFYADFRRLSHKTQVFSFPSNIIIHNRLTHSLEVANIAENLAEGVAIDILNQADIDINSLLPPQMLEGLTNNEEKKKLFVQTLMQITHATSLIHDIGNPPFGHSGEDSIREAFKLFIARYKDNDKVSHSFEKSAETLQDLQHLEGNAYGLHLVLTRNDLSLTFATIGSMIKYPIATKDWQKLETKEGCTKKNGILNFDINPNNTKDLSLNYRVRHNIMTILKELGLKQNDTILKHPLAYIMEAADDIAYAIMDLEDAFRLGLVNENMQLKSTINDDRTIKKVLLDLVGQGLSFDIADNDNIQQLTNKLSSSEIYTSDFSANFSLVRSKAIGTLSKIARLNFKKNYDLIMNGEFNKDLIFNSPELDFIKTFSRDYIYKTKEGLFLESASFNIITNLLNRFLEAFIETELLENRITPYLNIMKLLEQESSIFKEADTNDKKFLAIVGFIVRMSDDYAREFYHRITGVTTKGIE